MTNKIEAQFSKIHLRRATTALAALAAFGLGLVAIPSAKAQSLSVLYSFAGAPDGTQPRAGLIMDKAGNLYGTTWDGGPSGFHGTVFKVNASGSETVLHSFIGGDGEFLSAGLIMDKARNLYGTTQDGGAFGYGAVFKLDTSGNETVLHSFTNSSGDGANPYAGLIMDRAGNLYGTTFYGGANNYGTVFKLDTFGNETVLHSFTNSSGDGAYPYAGLIMDRAGNLYGTTSQGGVNYGTVFKLDTSGNETVLHSFNYADGNLPAAGLIMDRAGNLYGTTFYGGAFSYGTVFKLDTSGNETVLHSFAFSGGDGAYPYAPLIMDRAGNLYGTTFEGGADVYGTVFKLDTSGNETVLHSFPSLGGDGATPFFGALITDKAGNLYGTTEGGGASGYGTVFKLVP